MSTAISQKADVMDAVIAVSFKQMEDGVFTDATAPRITGNGYLKFRTVQKARQRRKQNEQIMWKLRPVREVHG